MGACSRGRTGKRAISRAKIQKDGSLASRDLRRGGSASAGFAPERWIACQRTKPAVAAARPSTSFDPACRRSRTTQTPLTDCQEFWNLAPRLGSPWFAPVFRIAPSLYCVAQFRPLQLSFYYGSSVSITADQDLSIIRDLQTHAVGAGDSSPSKAAVLQIDRYS